MKKEERIIMAGLIGTAAGFILATVLSPWSGDEIKEKIGLKDLPPEKKIKKLEARIKQLEDELKEKK